jgi:predicted metalloprotease with PDZ domain
VTLPRGGHAEVSLEVVRRRLDSPPGDVGISFGDMGLTRRIAAVREGSPAARAGLAVGDMVNTVDGASVARLDNWGLSTLLGNHSPGSALKLGVLHAGAPREAALVTVPVNR